MTEPVPVPSTARRAAVIGARAAGATIAVGIALITIAGASFLPLPDLAVTPASRLVTPVPVAQELVCPGTVLRLGDRDGQNASVPSALGEPALVTGASGGEASAEAFATEVGSPSLVTSSEPSAIAAGAQSQPVSSDDATGFAAASCSPVSTDSWLVGGATTVGRTTVLTLANPGEVEALVDLEIFGEGGRVDAPGSSGLAVAAHTQRVFSLAGLAPGLASPVVHVTSTGGSVSAHLQQTVVRGLENAGVDIVQPGASPARAITVPGLTVIDPETIEGRRAGGDPGAVDLGSVARVFVPGATAGTATVSITPVGAGSTGANFQAPLAAGVVSDISLEGLEAGTYSVRVTSDVPIVGGVRASTADGVDGVTGSSDVAWYASAAALVTPTAFAVAPGPSPTLHVTNGSDADATVTVTDADGRAVTLPIAATSSASVTLTTGVYRFESSAPVAADVGYSSSTELASTTIDPKVADADPILIYP